MSALDRQAAVLKGLIAALRADPALGALVDRRIYDLPPARPVMPALTLKLVGGADASSADSDAQKLLFDIDVWDRYAVGTDGGRPRAIMAAIRRILHLQPLATEGCATILVRCTGGQGPNRDPDGLSLHGIVTVTVLAGHEAAG